MQALQYSATTYCAYDLIDQWGCGGHCSANSGFKLHNRVNNPSRNTFGYTGFDATNNQIVLAFRGTHSSDLKNWMTNLNLVMVSSPYGNSAKVH